MSQEPRRFKSEEPFECLPNDLPAGDFIQYEAPIPSYVPHALDGRGKHVRVLLLAADWNGGEVGGKTPKGTVYLIHTYQDGELGRSGNHFSRRSFFLFQDGDGRGWLQRVKDDEQLITAIARGTSLPRLGQAFELPERMLGRIRNLLPKETP